MGRGVWARRGGCARSDATRFYATFTGRWLRWNDALPTVPARIGRGGKRRGAGGMGGTRRADPHGRRGLVGAPADPAPARLLGDPRRLPARFLVHAQPGR